MATSIISHTVLDPSEDPIAGLTVSATLIGGVYRISDGAEISRYKTWTTDVNGLVQMELERNADIFPTGSHWVINVEKTEAQGGATSHDISVGSVNATLYASVIIVAQTVSYSNFLTQAAADARYLQSGSFLPVTTDGIQYVTTGGSDANSGLSWGAAKSTIASAMSTLPATGGVIFLGKGSFSGQVLFTKSNVIIVGAGRELSKITYTGGSYAVGNSDPTTRRDRIGLAALTIDASGGTAGVIGLQVNNFQRCIYRDVYVNCGSVASGIGIQFVGSLTKSTYFNDFWDVDVTAAGACHDYGDQCNAERFFGGILDGAGVAIQANPATTATNTNTYSQMAIQTSNSSLMSLGDGAAQVSDWSFWGMRLEPSVVSTITIGANGSRIGFRDGSWSSDVRISCRVTSGCSFIIPQSGIFRQDSYPQPFDGFLPTDVGGYRGLSTNIPRNVPKSDQAVLTDGRLHMVLMYLHVGQTITRVAAYSGTTAMGTGANQWAAIFDSSRNKVAISDDDTTTAWGANARKLFAFSTPYVPTTSGWYYIGIMVNVSAGVVPSLLGITDLNAVVTAEPPILSGYADTGLTNPASCPATAAALTATAVTPLITLGG